MRTFATVISALGLVATLAAAPASAQQFFSLHPELTKDEFKEFIAELGPVMRFRQVGDTTTLGKGNFDIGVQFANTLLNDPAGVWNNTVSDPTAYHRLGRSISFPRVVARFGVSDRVDVGAFGGLDPNGKYGLLGVDTKIALLQQGPTMPVSVSIRPSIGTLIAPSEVWAGTASVDLSVSRAFGPVSPYVGVAATTSGAMERSKNVDLDPVDAGSALSYAGVSYRWRALVLSGEVEKGSRVRYSFGIGTRF
jgi:hypothetical protein